jgi:hypothetical protein
MARVSKFQEAAASADAAPERPPLRTSPKAEDPRERARKRAEEIREHLGGLDEGTDEFYIPASIFPDGWTYEWKSHMIFNQEDPAYTVQLRREGWDPVPVDRCARHRSMMPESWTMGTIERKGMVLMDALDELVGSMQRHVDELLLMPAQMIPRVRPRVETGRKYREAILEAGGSRPAMESFKAFRGREPSIDALMRHQGMA